MASYIEGLEAAAGLAVPTRVSYIGVLKAAAVAARNLRRD
jgi:hypothetical protein